MEHGVLGGVAGGHVVPGVEPLGLVVPVGSLRTGVGLSLIHIWLDAGGEPGVDQPERPRQIPHIPAAGDVGGQGVVQVEKGLILVVHKYPPLRFLSPA